MSTTDLLQVETIHTFIGQFHILEGVSLRVPRGSITALLGRNGAGKTTTLKSIIGLLSPREGRVLFDGQAINGRPAYEIASLGIGYVPEHRAVFRDLTVEENLKIAERFFTGQSSRFVWIKPQAGSIAFPRWVGGTPVEQFCQGVLDRQGVMIVPGSIFDFPGNHFRVGLGRKNFAQALERVHDYLKAEPG